MSIASRVKHFFGKEGDTVASVTNDDLARAVRMMRSKRSGMSRGSNLTPKKELTPKQARARAKEKRARIARRVNFKNQQRP